MKSWRTWFEALRRNRWIIWALAAALTVIAMATAGRDIFNALVAQRAALGFEFSGPFEVKFEGVSQLRLPDGRVLDEKPLRFTCLPPDDLREPGKCGIVMAAWPERGRGEQEWYRACFLVSGFRDPICVVHVPPGCDLSGAGCGASISRTGTVTVPPGCMMRLEACGTRLDGEGFWLAGPYAPVRLWKIYLPLVFGG